MAAVDVGLGKAAVDVGGDGFEVVFWCLYRRFGFGDRDEGKVVKGIVALAAHTVEERKSRRKKRIEVLPCEIDDGCMMPELYARTLAVAQHEGK